MSATLDEADRRAIRDLKQALADTRGRSHATASASASSSSDIPLPTPQFIDTPEPEAKAALPAWLPWAGIAAGVTGLLALAMTATWLLVLKPRADEKVAAAAAAGQTIGSGADAEAGWRAALRTVESWDDAVGGAETRRKAMTALCGKPDATAASCRTFEQTSADWSTDQKRRDEGLAALHWAMAGSYACLRAPGEDPNHPAPVLRVGPTPGVDFAGCVLASPPEAAPQVTAPQ